MWKRHSSFVIVLAERFHVGKPLWSSLVLLRLVLVLFKPRPGVLLVSGSPHISPSRFFHLDGFGLVSMLYFPGLVLDGIA